MPNEDYAEILLTYAQDVEDIRDKVVNEDGGENLDQWLDVAAKAKMPNALKYLRQEYMTSVGPLCKDNSLAHIVDVVNEAYKSQLKANHHLGKGISSELSSMEIIMDKALMDVKDKMTLDDAKMTTLERTNGDLKRKVGTLEPTISKLTTAQEKMVELMKEQVIEHQTTNVKINILYSNRYGDAPPSKVPMSGITVEDATKRDFDAHSANLETAKSIRDLQASVSTLFTAQEIITQDVKMMEEVSVQTREDMNLLLLNQQQIMVALNLPTPVLKPPTTSVVVVPTSSSRLAPFHLSDNLHKGEILVQGSSSLRNQQVVQHFQTQNHKEKLEYELLKQASLKDFEDEGFMRRLRHLKGSVGGEHWHYREILRSTIDFVRVVIKANDQVHLKEIIIKIDDIMFHISRLLLQRLSFVELEVINRKVKCVFQEDEALKRLLEDDMNAST